MRITIENVNKSFEQGKNNIHILKDISLNVQDGEVVALLGKSGSGKTTLLSMLGGLEKPDNGNITIDQTNLYNKTESELCEWRAQNIGIVFQQFHLIAHLTAKENVSLPLEILDREAEKEAELWLDKVGLKERMSHYPTMLSGGEQQRVAIARAMVTKPKLILADEPSGNLDVETGKKVMDLLFEIVKQNKTTMVLVTHDEELAKRADRIVHLVAGKCQ